MSRLPVRPALILAVLLVLAACTPASSAPSSAPSGSAIASESAAESEASSVAPSEAASTAPSDEPTDGLGSFACTPVSSPGTAPLANIADVRVGTHAGYDRVVFEFAAGIPEFTLDPAVPPFTQDASGLPLTVNGEGFWQLVMQGASKVSPEGGITYSGPTEFSPGFTQLVHLVEGGDFERVSTWYIGMAEADVCVRVFTLSAPDRLVIDIEQ